MMVPHAYLKERIESIERTIRGDNEKLKNAAILRNMTDYRPKSDDNTS